MSLQLNNTQLGKLTHPLDEIRLRALDQVEARFTRSLQLNEIIAFKPVQMVKQLILWFGVQPLVEAERVLALLLHLMRSAYASAIFRKISTTRLRTELDKVRRIVGTNSAANKIIDELQDLLREQRQRELEIAENNEMPTSSRNAVSTTNEAGTTNNEKIYFTSGSSETAVGGSSETEAAALAHLEEDYELPWSRPNVNDVTTMKLVADMLTNNFVCAADLDNALVHLQITMLDYPAEYLLQTPHLFQKLVQLHERVDGGELGGNHTLTLINRTLLSYIMLLKQRIQLRRKTLTYAAIDLTSHPMTAKTQLKPEVAIKLLLTRCLEHLEPLIVEFQPAQWQHIQLVRQLVKTCILLRSNIHIDSIRQVALMAQRLQRYCHEMQVAQVNLPRVKYLLLVSQLLEMIIHNENLSSSNENGNVILLLQPVLCDYAYKLYEPLRYAAVEELFHRHVEGFDQCNKQLHVHMDSFTLALEQLDKSTQLPPEELLMKQAKICLTVEILNSIRLVKVLFNAIVSCNAHYDDQPELRKEAEELLVTLLVLPNDRLRLTAHKLLRAAFLTHFHSFMDSENYVPGRTNLQLIQSHIFGVPLSFELLHMIIILGHGDKIPEIRQNCLDCLCLMLKTETFLCENYAKLLEPLQPLMPLLICLSCQNAELLELLKQLLLPDTSCMTFMQILRGNICFMFHPREDVRQEAIQRIMYMLRCKDHQNILLPDLMQIRDLIMNDVCVVMPPRDFLLVFSDRTPGEYSKKKSMFNLMLMLSSKDIDPLIRKTTVMQLNIMLQSWQGTAEYCKNEGFILPLNALTESVLKESATVYADQAIPAVGMLAKLMLHNDYFRQKMSEKEEIHMLTVRALFNFAHDLEMKQDGSLCLYLLIFASYIHVSEHGVEIPDLLSKLHVPVSYTVRKPTDHGASSYEISTMGSLVRSFFGGNQMMADTFWRLHIATVAFGGYEKIELPMHTDYDIASVLIIRKAELSLLETTNSPKQLKRYLKAAGNATDHQSLMKVISVLHLHLLQIRRLVPEEQAAALQQLLSKYLQLQPGNDLDVELFQQMLDLCIAALRQGLQPVIDGLSASLHADINHGFLELLKNPNTSLELFQQVAICLQCLLAAPSSFASVSSSKTKNSHLWFGTLFEMLQQRTSDLFKERDLPRVRCLLSVLRHLSMRYLARSDRELQQYSRQFMRLSFDLKVNTQTGAQWHRDSLRIICEIHHQVSQTDSGFRFSSSILRFLASLCGHNDPQVRALAWVVLADIASGYANGKSTVEVRKFLDEFQFLPGGFLACCLSTLLDYFETMLVRQLAGRVFGQLFKFQIIELTLQLLERHQFLNTSLKALAIAELNETLPISLDPLTAGDLESCEVITCYVHICTELLQQQPTWCEHLCTHAFTHKLYELFKVPPTPINMPYRRMCAQICQMYALCYSSAHDFLKRSLCRDPVFLKSFVFLLNDTLSAADMLLLVEFVKLLLVLCKDDTAFSYICEQLTQIPDLIVNLGLRAFTLQHVNTSLQRYTLSAFVLLLIKSQHHPEFTGDLACMELVAQPSLISVLEQHAALNVCDNSRSCTATSDAENDMNALNRQFGGMDVTESSKSIYSLSTSNLLYSSKSSLESTTSKSLNLPATSTISRSIAAVGNSNAVALIYIELDQLFTHLYPLRTCKFTQPPSNAQVQVCEALGVLLKLSPRAQQAARNLNLLERIVQIVQNYLNDPSSLTHIRRNGEHKAASIIRNLSLLFQLIFNWHTSHHAVITNELQGLKLIKIIVDIWPWLQYSAQLRLIIVNICAFISEHSFVVCKLMSLPASSQSNSILHLIVKHVNFETSSVHASSSESFPVIQRSLRVMINCCACSEGRMSLVKLHVLDIFDGLLPGNNSKRHLKAKPDILNAWLRFWELYSRYEHGAKACHLQTLLATVQRSQPRSQTRLLCLRILRNMCFVPTNRTQLTTTMPLLETWRDIIMQPMPAVIDLLANTNAGHHGSEVIVIDSDNEDQSRKAAAHGGGSGGRGSRVNDASYEEQRLVTVALWKLFGSGAKYKAMLRGTKLAKQMTILHEHLLAINAEQPQCMERLPYARELLKELTHLFEAINC